MSWAKIIFQQCIVFTSATQSAWNLVRFSSSLAFYLTDFFIQNWFLHTLEHNAIYKFHLTYSSSQQWQAETVSCLICFWQGRIETMDTKSNHQLLQILPGLRCAFICYLVIVNILREICFTSISEWQQLYFWSACPSSFMHLTHLTENLVQTICLYKKQPRERN